MPRRRLLSIAAAVLLAACSTGHDDAATVAPVTTTEATTTSTAAAPEFSATIVNLTAADLPASWRVGCPHPVEQLRAIDATHWAYDGEVHTGRLVVDAALADGMVEILRDLFDAGFPIEKMEPIDVYGGSDEASTAANNTSAFNCRPATGGTAWSEHAYGRAIDVNPRVNPYVKGDLVLPPQSAVYVDRTRTDPGLIHEGDAAVAAFAEQGWIWGGTWSSLKDYQHFSPSGR